MDEKLHVITQNLSLIHISITGKRFAVLSSLSNRASRIRFGCLFTDFIFESVGFTSGFVFDFFCVFCAVFLFVVFCLFLLILFSPNFIMYLHASFCVHILHKSIQFHTFPLAELTLRKKRADISSTRISPSY